MKNYKEYVKHIRDEIAFIKKESQDLTYESLVENQVLLRAFIRSIEVIGEAAKQVPDEIKEQ